MPVSISAFSLPFNAVHLSVRVTILYLVALFANLTGCNFYYLQPQTTAFPHNPVPTQVTTIAFASCNNDNKQSGVFASITGLGPDLFVWTGDIIYPDRPIPWPGNNLDKIAHKYARLQRQPAYQSLASHIPVTGIWDDHDFGHNNGGSDYPWKAESSALFRSFMGTVESDYPAEQGIYRSYHLQSGSLKYSLLLLDTRYFREKPSASATILGKHQWEWLINELERPEADLFILVSGTSIISNDNENEGWSKYPKEQERIFNIIKSINKKVVIVAGDKHYAEINSLRWNDIEIQELVASGVTHTERPGRRYKNNITASQRFEGINFGWMVVGEDGEVVLQARDEAGHVQLEQRIQPYIFASTGAAGETRAE